MKFSSILFTTGSVLLQSQHGYANPISATNLVARGKADILASILKIFNIILKDGPERAWDYKENSQMCSIYMETRDGANCRALVDCDDGRKEYNVGGATWNVCYVGGRQFFNDPRIGEFSITFEERDGLGQGEGLTTPKLQLKSIGDWQEIPVQELTSRYNAYQNCKAHNGVWCDKGPYICHWSGMGDQIMEASRTKGWECGVPKIGRAGAGLDSNAPVNDKGYAPGWCGIHVTQYQKPDPSKDDYTLEVPHLNDANENKIGSIGRSGAKISLTSKLPLTVEISAGAVDADPVRFAYGGQFWDSNDSTKCSVGLYDSGKREMDCGFTCD